MQYLVHFYYGERKEAIFIAIGTLIRGAGHNLKSTIVLPQIVCKLFRTLKEEHIKMVEIFKEKKNSSLDRLRNQRDHILFFPDVDRLIKKKDLKLSKFRGLINQLVKNNEIILTSKKPIPELIEISDYVSKLSYKR